MFIFDNMAFYSRLRFGGKRGVRGGECGVWKIGSVENAGCGKCGVWKMRGVENAECGKCRNMKLTNNLIPLYSH